MNARIENTSHAGSDKVLQAKERMSANFNALVSDAEELLRSTASYSGESVNAARTRFKETLNDFKTRVSDVQGTALGKWNEASEASALYVRENPWKVIGAAVAVGLIVGALLHRKQKE